MSNPLTLPGRRGSISKSLIKRRTLLKGLGGSSFLAVPVFRAALAEAQAAPVRLLILYFPGGALMNGTDKGLFTYEQMLSPVADLRSDILMIDNVIDPVSPNGVPYGHGGERIMLTGDGRGVEEDIYSFTPPGMTSIDQHIARSVGQSTKHASLQFGVASQRGLADGYDVALVWSNGAPIHAVQDPATMFTRLFGNGVPTGPAPTGSTPEDLAALARLQAIAAQRRSMLDLLKGQVTDIQAMVGSAEKLRLEEHLSALRELEKSIISPSGGGGVVASPGATCGAPSLGAGTDVPALSAQMSELFYQAVNCDATRVASLEFLTSGYNSPFRWIGVNAMHHEMQHFPDANFAAAQTWLMSQIAVVLKRLKNTPEGSGSLLDNCAVFVTSEMGHGANHDNNPIPAFIAGKAGGQLSTGRTVNVNGQARANLLVNLAQLMGVPLSNFGDPAWVTGPLALG